MKTIKSEFTVVPRSSIIKASNLTAALALNSMAAYEILMQLGREHEAVAGGWLDDLQAWIITKARRQALEGLSIDDESEARQFGVDTLQMMSEFTRSKLKSAF